MGQIVRWDARKDVSFVQTLAFDLDAETAARFGRCFGIIAADTKGRKGQALSAHLEDAFSRGAAEAVRKLPPDAPQDQLFEAAIARVNHALGRLFGDYGLEIEPETVTAAIVSFVGQDVVASTWGKPTLLLYHPMADGSYRAFDLADDGGPDPRNPRAGGNNRRCFGSIIAGRMGRRDRMLLASHDIRGLLGDDEVAHTVLANEPQLASEVLDQLVAPNHGGSVAAMVLDVTEIRYLEHDYGRAPTPAPAPVAPEPPKRGRKKTASPSHESIASLLRVQNDAAETIKPTLMGGLGKKVEALFTEDEPADSSSVSDVPVDPPELPPEPPAVAYAPEPEREYEGERKPAVIAVTIAKFAWRMLKALAFAVAAGAGVAWRFTASIIRGDTRTQAIADLREGVRSLPANAWRRISGMSLVGKLVGVVAIALFITAQVMLAGHRREVAAEESLALYERTVDTINQKIDAAEASIIYRDEYRAKALLTEASNAVNALAADTPERTAERDALQKKIAESQNALRREVPLPSAQVLANINTASGAPTLTRIERGEGTAYWLASSAGEVFSLNAKDGAVAKSGDAPNGTAPALFVPNGRDLLVIGSSGSGSLMAAGGTAKDRTVDFGGEASVTDAGLYGGRLYVLDAAHNRIVRHEPGTGAYGASQPYLKDGTDLSGAVSMAIDGFVWVLRKDGSVVRIAKGTQESFAVGAPEPAIANASRLRTEADGDLFILETSPARIVRFNKKTGALMAQYTSPSLNGATDFALTADSKTAYVTVKNQVLAFPLPDAK